MSLSRSTLLSIRLYACPSCHVARKIDRSAVALVSQTDGVAQKLQTQHAQPQKAKDGECTADQLSTIMPQRTKQETGREREREKAAHEPHFVLLLGPQAVHMEYSTSKRLPGLPRNDGKCLSACERNDVCTRIHSRVCMCLTTPAVQQIPETKRQRVRRTHAVARVVPAHAYSNVALWACLNPNLPKFWQLPLARARPNRPCSPGSTPQRFGSARAVGEGVRRRA